MKISQLHIHLYAPEPTTLLTAEERIEVYDRVIARLEKAKLLADQTEATVDRICDKLEIPELEETEPATCTVDRYIKDQGENVFQSHGVDLNAATN